MDAAISFLPLGVRRRVVALVLRVTGQGPPRRVRLDEQKYTKNKDDVDKLEYGFNGARLSAAASLFEYAASAWQAIQLACETLYGEKEVRPESTTIPLPGSEPSVLRR